MVRCCDCGYLAVRNFKTREIVEAPDEFRETAKIPPGEGGRNLFDDYPICFVRQIVFRDILNGDTSRPASNREIHADRDCPQFIDWIQGFSSKEHAELIQQKAAQEWQRQMADDERQWRSVQAERDRQWRKEDREDAESRFWKERYAYWIAGVWTFAVTVVGWWLTIQTMQK